MDAYRIDPEAPTSEKQLSRMRGERKRVKKIIKEIIQGISPDTKPKYLE